MGFHCKPLTEYQNSVRLSPSLSLVVLTTLHTALNLCPGALHTVKYQHAYTVSATAERWHFSAFIIHVDRMELELHDNHYNIVHVADECPIVLAQFV